MIDEMLGYDEQALEACTHDEHRKRLTSSTVISGYPYLQIFFPLVYDFGLGQDVFFVILCTGFQERI